jgi:hypothetical protein
MFQSKFKGGRPRYELKDIRKIENFGVALWLLEDLAWFSLWRTPIAAPTAVHANFLKCVPMRPGPYRVASELDHAVQAVRVLFCRPRCTE